MAETPVGTVTHYYNKIGVAVVKLNKGGLSVGDEIKITGNTTDFTQKINSMQIDHKDIKVAEKGQEFGLKVDQEVREEDNVFKV